MKKLSLFLIGLLLIPALFLTSCDRGDDITEGGAVTYEKFDVLKDYMVDNGYDLPTIDTSVDGKKFVVGAPAEADLETFLNTYYIIDIRSADTYSKGHIKGAKNVAFADILTEGANADAAGKPALVVCYTGQTACYATSLMRMYGYKNTQALKWGMSGWNSTTADKWNNGIGNIAQDNSNWSNSSAPATIKFSDPDFGKTTDDDGMAFLHERVETVIADGFKTASGADVLATPSNYFINNYFSEADYTAYGHIANAYRINPLTLADGQYQNIDPASTTKVVTYCYTGQTSAVVTAWLRVLGYDAYSLTYGMNGLYNDNPAWGTSANRWKASNSKDLPLVTN